MVTATGGQGAFDLVQTTRSRSDLDLFMPQQRFDQRQSRFDTAPSVALSRFASQALRSPRAITKPASASQQHEEGDERYTPFAQALQSPIPIRSTSIPWLASRHRPHRLHRSGSAFGSSRPRSPMQSPNEVLTYAVMSSASACCCHVIRHSPASLDLSLSTHDLCLNWSHLSCCISMIGVFCSEENT